MIECEWIGRIFITYEKFCVIKEEFLFWFYAELLGYFLNIKIINH